MVHLKFIRPMANYRIDDVATFENERVADKIIEQGYAEEVTLESTKIEDNSKKK